MPQLRVALAQIDVTVGDLDGNADLIVEWSHKAADAGAHLVASFRRWSSPATRRKTSSCAARSPQPARRRCTGWPRDWRTRGSAAWRSSSGYLDTADEPVRAGRATRGRAGERLRAALRRPRRRPLCQAPPAQLRRLRRVPLLRARRPLPGDAPARRRRRTDASARTSGRTAARSRWPRAPTSGSSCASTAARTSGCKSYTRDELAARRAREAGAALGLREHGGRSGRAGLRRRQPDRRRPGRAVLARAPQFAETLLIVDLDLPAGHRRFHRAGRCQRRHAYAGRAHHRLRRAAAEPTSRCRSPSSTGSTPTPSSTRPSCSAPATTSPRTVSASVALGLSGGIDSALVATIAVDALGADCRPHRRDAVGVLVGPFRQRRGRARRTPAHPASGAADRRRRWTSIRATSS